MLIRLTRLLKCNKGLNFSPHLYPSSHWSPCNLTLKVFWTSSVKGKSTSSENIQTALSPTSTLLYIFAQKNICVKLLNTKFMQPIQKYTCVPWSGFNQSNSRPKKSFSFSIFYHSDGNAIFHTSSRIQKFTLCHCKHKQR